MPEAMEMTAYAATLRLTASRPLPADRWTASLVTFFTRLGQLYRSQKGVTIGHIKGFLRLAGGDCAYLSTVGTAAGASCRLEKAVPAAAAENVAESGGASGKSSGDDSAVLDFNVILLGLSEDETAALLMPEVTRLAEELDAQYQLTKAEPKQKGGFIKKK